MARGGGPLWALPAAALIDPEAAPPREEAPYTESPVTQTLRTNGKGENNTGGRWLP